MRSWGSRQKASVARRACAIWHGHNAILPDYLGYNLVPCNLFQEDSTGTGYVLVSWNDWQKEVGRMFSVAVDFVQCRFAFADVPHHIICFGVGRNIDT